MFALSIREKLNITKHNTFKRTTIMKSIQVLFVLFITLVMVQTTKAQNSLATYNGNAAISTLDGIGERTTSGAVIISAYQEGAAITKMYNKFGLVNAQGLEIVTPRFEEVRGFKNGYAAVKLHGKWSFINKQGKKIASFRFDWVGSFTNGFAPVQINGKWGFINEQGAKVGAIEFDAVQNFDRNKALVRKGNTWYFLTNKGNIEKIKSTAQTIRRVTV